MDAPDGPRLTLLSCPRAWRRSSPTRWYVIFCEVEDRRWWDRLLGTPAGFSHVYALRWDGFNWLVFNPSVQYTDVAISACTAENALHELLPPGATVLEVEAFRSRDRIRGRWWVGPMTCVEQVKALLGLPVGWIFTPWQLYRYLESLDDGQQTQHAGADGPGEERRAQSTARARRAYP